MTNQRPAKKAASQPGVPNPEANGQGPAALLAGLPDSQKTQIAGIIQLLFEKLKPQHKPVLTALKEMGVRVKQRNVGGAECLVIEIDELMRKEYLHMSGIDLASLDESEDE